MFTFVLDVIRRLVVAPEASKAPSSSESSSASSSTSAVVASNSSALQKAKSSSIESGSDVEDSTADYREANAAELIKIGTHLNDLMKACQGDTGKLRSQIIKDVESETFLLSDIRIVLSDNILACRQANFVNKVKVFEFLDAELRKFDEQRTLKLQQEEEKLGNSEVSSTYHAPKFVDSMSSSESWKRVDVNDSKLNVLIDAPVRFIEGKCSAEIKIANRKNKKEKKKKEDAIAEVAENVGQHLGAHGWSVCDDFLSQVFI
jgi:hypothetical protein